MRAWALLLLCAACGSDPKILPAGASCEMLQQLPMSSNRKLDLVFVIDTSAGMRERQAMLAANLPQLMEIVTTSARPLDLQLAVVSADLAQDGVFQTAPRLAGCAPPEGAFIRWKNKLRGGFDTNFSGALREVFPCIASLGAEGGEPRPIAALKRALENPANAGFVRDDAYLGVVIISTVDDATPADWLRAVKLDPNLVVVSVAGPPSETALHGLVGGSGEYTSVLNDDITDVLNPYFRFLSTSIGTPCIPSGVDATDIDAAEPGLQLGCQVELARFYESPSATSRTMERCRMDGPEAPRLDALPCWWVRPRPIQCEFASGLELAVELVDWPEVGSSVVSHCPAVCR